MYISRLVHEVLVEAKEFAKKCHHEYVTPEHVLYIMCDTENFSNAFIACGGNIVKLKEDIENYLGNNIDRQKSDKEVIESFGLQQTFLYAGSQIQSSGKDTIELDHILAGIMYLQDSYAVYYITIQDVALRDLLFEMCHQTGDEYPDDYEDGYQDNYEDEYDESEYDDTESEDDHQSSLVNSEEASHKSSNDDINMKSTKTSSKAEKEQDANLLKISKYVTELTKVTNKKKEPIIGREDILARTLQVLSRKNKNNPIHIGEPGVGKTAITMGISNLINEDKVPDNLKESKIFSLDLGAVLAGTQYRGDFEKRLKGILEIISKEKKPIVYIDEIHNIVGAGALGEGSLDASNLLKPYLTDGTIKFIGSTTYDEYKKYVEKDKGLARRFQTIEVPEPTPEETITILTGLKESYESYHGITYTTEAIEGAVNLSKQYINDRFLPDKAIDLLDEAGAYYTIFGNANKKSKKNIIDLSIIEQTIARVCHIPAKKVEKSDAVAIAQLEKQLKKQVFGQDKAIEQIVTRIKLSRAGLGEGTKPVASLLFVGPTGVGKTEIAKCLAEDLGVKLIRFDMSEYTEKHTASKLIGSPPGYVGYEEGGLLTDAIKKNPYCVLLLDEIEKAHQDIYNILLQVMDYATLTDNQGRKADFQNVILIMTSNAGASQIGKKLVGFGERKVKGEVMADEVKKVFSPEFRNRLTDIVVFNHLSDEMAKLIVNKELAKLKVILKEKNIEVTFNKRCISHIMDKGVSAEYGAREISRLIESKIKPLLAEEILFGKPNKDGKKYKVSVQDEKFMLEAEEKPSI